MEGEGGLVTDTLSINGKPAEKSDYNPDDRVKARTSDCIQEFWYARQVMNNPYLEFNNKDVVSELTEDQRSFNAWTPPKSEDPDEAWLSDAYDPIVRNKVISIAAHLTRAMVMPQWEAYNSESHDQRDAAYAMGHLVEWAAYESGYVQNFLYAVFDALVTPAAIVHHEYAEVYRDIKIPTAEVDQVTKQKWTIKTVLDEEYSGFQDTLLGVDELFIANPYIPGRQIQRQPYLIWRRMITWEEAYAKYHRNENFQKYVRKGVQLLFDQQTLLFYRQYDENLRGRMCEEVIYWNRQKDLRLVFVNGVMLTDPDQPNPRLDKKYPFVVGGYSPFNHRFFWYSSLVKAMSNNERAVNDLYRMIVDGTQLQLFKPVAVIGEESVDSSIPIPGNIVNLKADTKLNPLDFGNNLNAGIEAYTLIRKNLSETATSDRTPDNETDATALQISQEDQEAMVMLGMFAKMISFMVNDWGMLFMGDVLQHMTVPQLDQILGADTDAPLKYRTFALGQNASGGTKKQRRISFVGDLQEKMQDKPRDKHGRILDFDRLTEEGGLKGKHELIDIDPAEFRKLKFKCRTDARDMLPPSDAVMRALNLEEFDRMIQSPNADQEEALLFLLGSYPATRDNPDRFVSKTPQGANPAAQNGVMPKGLPGGIPDNGAPGNGQGGNPGALNFPKKAPVRAQGAMQNIMGAQMAQNKPAMKAV